MSNIKKHKIPLPRFSSCRAESINYKQSDVLNSPESQFLYCFYIVPANSCDFEIDGKTTTIKHSSLLCVENSQPHKLIFTKTGFIGRIIYITDKKEKISDKKILPTTLEISPHISKIAETLILSQSNFEHVPQEEMEAFIKPLASSFLALIHISVLRPNDNGKKTNSVITAATRYIDNQYYSDLSVNDIAAYCGVTVQHLSRLFKQHGLPPPMKHFWNRRLEQALEFLISTGMSIKDIAEKSGFKTTHHFSNKIKSKTGLSPKEYRNLYSKKDVSNRSG